MFSRRRLQVGVCLATTMVLSSVANAATKNPPSRVAQMTPSVCWEACSGTCDKTYEKCAVDNADRIAECRMARDTCHDQCSDRCGLKK
jgi:hypothetical protein